MSYSGGLMRPIYGHPPRPFLNSHPSRNGIIGDSFAMGRERDRGCGLLEEPSNSAPSTDSIPSRIPSLFDTIHGTPPNNDDDYYPPPTRPRWNDSLGPPDMYESDPNYYPPPQREGWGYGGEPDHPPPPREMWGYGGDPPPEGWGRGGAVFPSGHFGRGMFRHPAPPRHMFGPPGRDYGQPPPQMYGDVSRRDFDNGWPDNSMDRFPENENYWDRLDEAGPSLMSKRRTDEERQCSRVFLLDAPPMQSNFSRHLLSFCDFEDPREPEYDLLNDAHPAYKNPGPVPLPDDREFRRKFLSLDGPEVFPLYFDSRDSLKTFDKAYEQSIWDYDPKFTWDYLPNTKRGTKKVERNIFVMNQDYIQEEHKWEKWGRVLHNFWSKQYVPKVIAKQKMIEAGIEPPDDKKKKLDKPQADYLLDYLTENVQFTEDMCTAEYCGLCDFAFQSVLPSITHYEEKRHEKAVVDYFIDALYAENKIQDEDFEKQWYIDFERRLLKFYKWKPEDYFCHICEVGLSSAQMAKAHFAGSSHNRRLRGLPTIQKLPPHKKQMYDLQCVACQVTFRDEADADAHIQTVKHITNVRACGVANISLPPGPSGRVPNDNKSRSIMKRASAKITNSVMPSLQSVGATVRAGGQGGGGGASGNNGDLAAQIGYTRFKKANDMQSVTAAQDGGGTGGNLEPMGKMRQFGSAANENIHCDLCKKSLPNQQAYQIHLESQNHIQKESLAAQRVLKTGRKQAHQTTQNFDRLPEIVTAKTLGRIVPGPSRMIPSLEAALAKAKAIPSKKQMRPSEFQEWGDAGAGLGQQIWGEEQEAQASCYKHEYYQLQPNQYSQIEATDDFSRDWE